MHALSTILISGFFALSGGAYFLSQSMIDGLEAIGFPAFFRVQLGALQIVAAIVLLVPNMPLPVREWAYAGAGLLLLTSIVAHVSHGDPVVLTAVNVVLLGLLIVSRYTLPTVG